MDTRVRIEDLLNVLADPEEYVRGILSSFIEENFDRDVAVVRIGTSGEGSYPHYCIEEGSELLTLATGVTLRVHTKRCVFHGRSHRLILERELKGAVWSEAGSSYTDVQSILGGLRASRRNH